ncbi:MAG TPA: uroporphyrinogen-III synthase, partial [Candidatus Competibacteraceae bacterium]|nr:uroporphyrinogen-III synthase [Candidatus Competibacteraceae bacterium]
MTGSLLPLQGMGILVTRPERQAGELCRLIEARGGRAIRCPTLEILPFRDPAPALAVIDHLDDYELAIFTSANAVNLGLELLLSRRPLPLHWQVFAVGKATARALVSYGIDTCRTPERGANSEALLALPELQQVAGKTIVIFRGEGGREVLGETLQARGARVDPAIVYRRSKPAFCPDDLLQYWKRGEIQAVIATSNESLQNLLVMVGAAGRPWLLATPLVVI